MSANVVFGIWWLSLSFINAGLAQTRGRSGWQWWVGSLIVGPIATALIVIWPSLKRD